MGNVLKYDLYRMVKDKKLYFIYALVFVADVFIRFYRLIGEPTDFFWFYETFAVGSDAIAVSFALVLFITSFVGNDFSSKAVNNVYAQVNKLHYVISKVLCSFLFILAFHVFDLLLCLCIGIIFNGGIAISDDFSVIVDFMKDPNVTKAEAFKKYFFLELRDFTVFLLTELHLSALAVAEMLFIKRGVVVLGGHLLFLFGFYNPLCEYVNKIFGRGSTYLFPVLLMADEPSQPWFVLVRGVACLAFSALFVVLGWQIFEKRKV